MKREASFTHALLSPMVGGGGGGGVGLVMVMVVGVWCMVGCGMVDDGWVVVVMGRWGSWLEQGDC